MRVASAEIGDRSAEVSSAAPSTDNPSQFDPRSFLAKSVPQRMAIISAGVV